MRNRKKLSHKLQYDAKKELVYDQFMTKKNKSDKYHPIDHPIKCVFSAVRVFSTVLTQYCWECSVPFGGGYLEYCGGDILRTVRDIQYTGGYLECCGGYRHTCGFFMVSIVERYEYHDIPPRYSRYASTVLNIPSMVLKRRSMRSLS